MHCQSCYIITIIRNSNAVVISKLKRYRAKKANSSVLDIEDRTSSYYPDVKSNIQLISNYGICLVGTNTFEKCHVEFCGDVIKAWYLVCTRTSCKKHSGW